MTQEHLNALRLNGTDALLELEAATKSVQTELQKSITNYEELLEAYTSLKEKQDKRVMSEPGESRGYVMVLVDACGLNFIEELRGGGVEGGFAVADRLLRLFDSLVEHERPDLAGVDLKIDVYSNSMPESFAQGFSSANVLCDFINVTSPALQEKIKGMLHWSLEDKRCTHLYFLAADLLQYIDELRELQQHSDGDHITLVKQRSPEAGGLEWMYTKLSKFFASECVNTASMVASDMARGKTSAKVQNDGLYGYFKNNRYIMRTPPKSDMESGFAKSSSILAPPPCPILIPINNSSHRLDAVLRPPKNAEHAALLKRTKTRRLCSSYYLSGSCPMEKCRYDHTPISPAALYALKYKLSKFPCHFGGACRRKDCFNGHVCFKKRCTGLASGKCKFGKNAHAVDMEVAQWVEPVAGWVNEVKGKEDKNRGMKKLRNGDGSEETNSKSSIKNRPTKFGILIDI